MDNILQEIKKERERQNEKWGEQNHNLVEWMAILTEEVGEASKEAVDFHFGYGLALAKQNEITHCQNKRLQNYRKELIQVCAVAVQMIECLDRNELN